MDRMFRVAEDFRLTTAMEVVDVALHKFAEAVWEALLHLNMSPKPSLAKVVPEVVQQGLGRVGSFLISNELWHEIVPADFLEKAQRYDVEADLDGGAGKVSEMVRRFFESVRGEGLLRELPECSKPSVYPSPPRNQVAFFFLLWD